MKLSACCWHCGRSLYVWHHGLCSVCLKMLKMPPRCPRCGIKIDPQMQKVMRHNHFCGKCPPLARHWQRMIVASDYAPPLSTLIHRFKFQKQYFLDRTLARILLLAVQNERRHRYIPLPDLLISVPLHHHRQWQRGYNQSANLGRYLSHWLNIPHAQNLIIRHQHRPAQRGLSAHQRRKNLRQAFTLNSTNFHKIFRPNLNVAIIDDVITTGATMAEICKLLHQHGITHIQVWALARA